MQYHFHGEKRIIFYTAFYHFGQFFNYLRTTFCAIRVSCVQRRNMARLKKPSAPIKNILYFLVESLRCLNIFGYIVFLLAYAFLE